MVLITMFTMPLPYPYHEIWSCFEGFWVWLSDSTLSSWTSIVVFTILTICLPAIFSLVFFEFETALMRPTQPRGCSRLGVDAFHTKSYLGQKGQSSASSDCWRVSSLWIYPVKSCSGIELNQASVLSTGMAFDRQFSFAQLTNNLQQTSKAARKWDFITQRQYPLLATVKTQVWVSDKTVKGYAPQSEESESGGVILISFPFQRKGLLGLILKLAGALRGTAPEKTFRVPLKPSPRQIKKAGFEFEKMTIWKDTVYALNLGSELPKELRLYLGVKNDLTLFRVDSKNLREVYRCAPRKEDLGWQPVTGFQDAVRTLNDRWHWI